MEYLAPRALMIVVPSPAPSLFPAGFWGVWEYFAPPPNRITVQIYMEVVT